jgi:uncharacterized repeat protein (TIGR01451 family)
MASKSTTQTPSKNSALDGCCGRPAELNAMLNSILVRKTPAGEAPSEKLRGLSRCCVTIGVMILIASLVRSRAAESANLPSPVTASNRKLAEQLRLSYDVGDTYATPSGMRSLRRLAGAMAIRSDAQDERKLIARGAPLDGYWQTVTAGSIRLFETSRPEKLRQVSTPDTFSAALSRARKTPVGKSANPVFVDPATGLRLLATEQLVLRMKAGVGAKKYFGATWRHIQPVSGTTNEFILTMPDATAEQVLAEVTRRSADAEIEWAEPDFISEVVKSYVPNDPYFASHQWHLNNTGQLGGAPGADAKLPGAWDLTTGNPNVVIAFLDDGVQLDHPDLAANIFQNAGEIPGNGLDDDLNGFRDDLHGWDFFRGDSDPSPEDPEDDHGTAVAGVAAAVGNNSLGVSGAAPGCRILPLKVLNGEFGVSSSGLARAMRYAAGLGATGLPVWRGADIISISLVFSSSLTTQSAFQDAVNKGRGGRGCPIFVAAGNSAAAWEPIDYYVTSPGTYTLRWEYTKDVSDIPPIGSDAAWLDSIIWPDGTHETFENGFPAGWVTSASAPWTVVTDGVNGDHALVGWNGPGSHALRSGHITHNQTTYVEVTKFLPAGPMRSWIWVSSELDYDFLRFKVNGVQEFRESGVPILTTQVDYPASLPQAIAVGASTDFDYRSDYSEYGTKLDFVAPSDGGAAGIFTTDRTGANGYNDGTEEDGDYTRGFGGTSSATPLASGIAALMLSLNPYLTASDVRALMRQTCDKIGAVAYDANGRNIFYGSGRLDATRAVQATRADLSIAITASANPATQGDITTFTITVENNGPGRSGPLVVSGQLPSNTSFGSATPEPSSRMGNQLTFSGATLASGATALFKITVTNLLPGTDLISADVSSDVIETNLNDNSASLVTTVLAVPTISISDSQSAEGSAGIPAHLVFDVTLDQPSSRTITVAYSTVTNTAGRTDFKAVSGVLTFLQGEVAKQITVDTVPDELDESDEAFFVKLSNPVGAVLGQAQATGTILDDDQTPTLFANNITVRESNGSRAATFLIRLSARSGRPVTIDFATQARTADAGSDFVATNGTLVFPPGKTLLRLPVTVLSDTIFEGTEFFDLQLQNPTNATLAQPQCTCTILDNEPPPKLSINDVVVTEGDSSVDAIFNVRLSAPVAVPVSVSFATTNGSAVAGLDFVETNGVLTFLPGQTNLPMAIRVLGDLLSESNEFFSVRLTNPTNGTLADALGRATILDNDPLPALTILDAAVTENDLGPTNALFDVFLSRVSGRTVSVGFATVTGTATAPADFVAKSGTLTFLPGTTNQTVSVVVNKDALVESNEMFFVKLSAPVNASLVNTQAVGTILAALPLGALPFRIVDGRFDGPAFRLRFQTQAGLHYKLESNVDPCNSKGWNSLPGAGTIQGDGGIVETTAPQPSGTLGCFYRIRLVP